MSDKLNALLETGPPPKWMTTGRTVLITKDRKNYRPSTCIPIHVQSDNNDFRFCIQALRSKQNGAIETEARHP